MLKVKCVYCDKIVGAISPNGTPAVIHVDIDKKVRMIPVHQVAKNSYGITTRGEQGIWGKIDVGKRGAGSRLCYRPHYLTCKLIADIREKNLWRQEKREAKSGALMEEAQSVEREMREMFGDDLHNAN